MNNKITIGIEIHAVVTATKMKLFSRAQNVDTNEPNTHVDLLDIGMPGALPVLNHDAVTNSVRACLALNMKINQNFAFDRKHYFYPDSPQGYQLTQLFKPIGIQGGLEIHVNNNKKYIRIKQVHMETDAGKSMHEGKKTMLDFNRCGAPLIEIVTEPDFCSADEVIAFLRLLHSTLRYSAACDCSMESGNFRVDVSISVEQNNKRSMRTEIKNLNSYRAIRKAIEFEYNRHCALLATGESLQQECRLFNGTETVFMRVKESAEDYMYFPEPDLPEYLLEDEIIEIERARLGDMLPEKLIPRFMHEFNLSYDDSFILIEDKAMYLFLETAFQECNEALKHAIIKIVRRMVFRKLNEGEKLDLSPEELRDIAHCVIKYGLNTLITERLFNEVWNGVNVNDFIKKEGLDNITTGEEIAEAIRSIFIAKPIEASRYCGGEEKLKGLFVGEIMRKFSNKADPKIINQILEEEKAAYADKISNVES